VAEDGHTPVAGLAAVAVVIFFGLLAPGFEIRCPHCDAMNFFRNYRHRVMPPL
jgi:hypothetical protein